MPSMKNLSLAANSHASMLQLQLEIINLITDSLALSDKVYLSQTCTALRRIMFAFWEGIAHQSANHWACQNCCELHLANSYALKTLGDNCLPCGFILHGRLNLDGICIDYHHVQFALKLSRLGNMEQTYLEMMMRPFRSIWKHKCMDPIQYTADARIIHERFIFRQEWIVNGHERAVSATIQTQSWTTAPRVITDLEDGIGLAMELPGQWVFISCPRCPTDCGIIVSEGNQEATIQSWHDLGTEGPQSDMSSGVHVSAGIYDDWIDQGMEVDYTHGSIRALWLEDDVGRRIRSHMWLSK
ncbi:hypothetical protein J3F84DRAFT_396087 [Trichoderma pleuroticola]